MAIFPRHPPHQNVLDIPTPPLQAAGIFVIFFFTAAAFIVWALRVYSRLRTRQWGMDDYMVSLGMLCSLAMVGPFYMYFKLYYFGWHTEDVPQPHDMLPAMWWFYIAQMLYNPILAFVKASVLLFLLRLGGQKPGVRLVIHSLNAFNALQAVAIFFVALLQCLPIAANWDFSLRADPNTKCIDNSFHVIASSLTLFTDILILVIPFWIFLGLKMKKAAKVAVLGIFMLGFAVFVIGIVRLRGLIKLFYPSPNDVNKDPFYDITVTLSVVEANVAIISASAPALRPLFQSWMPVLFGYATGYGKSGNKYTAGSKLPYAQRTKGTTGGNTTLVEDGVTLKSIKHKRGPDGHIEARSESPTGSEEEIMTYNGILRTTDVRVQYDGSSTIGGDRLSRVFSRSTLDTLSVDL
ncbi:hypothetical protein QBC38DRAFT_537931 [Podospora fimiseda]|uniref:Rhodopsin domain-containing protein n=1 Tax=Podospora fimiseda TaxID=252190 RepID=A0AAN7BL25_9PEZI|nr:hypothetical protein QBC38DRAFT_537931 [Podospora fimiseda]